MDDLAATMEALRREPAPVYDRARRERLLKAVSRLQRRGRNMLLAGYCALGAAFVFALAAGLQSLTAADKSRLTETPRPDVATRALLIATSDDRARPPSGAEHTNATQSRPLATAAGKANIDWRSLYQSGDYAGAAQRLFEAGAEVANDPAVLMDAADVARLSEHPEASVGYLSRVLREYAASPVAPLAGFTLGRVLLERLGQPADAAEAFAFASSSARGSLAQDALAREVEAWSKAGRSHEAYERAQLYVRRYPSGWRLHAVRLYGGLE
jgi:transmembrane sensor